MSYVTEVLQPGEVVLATGTKHWVIYLRGIFVLVLAAVLFILGASVQGMHAALQIAAAIVAVIGLMLIFAAWFHAASVEIAVTNRRIIYKRGIIRRETEEMNVDKVETVMVRQSVLGRILGYGTIDIRGTGDGIEDLRTIAHPLRFRSAITTHAAPS